MLQIARGEAAFSGLLEPHPRVESLRDARDPARAAILFRPEPYAVETWVNRIGTSSYDLGCRITGGKADDSVYSNAEVRLVAFDVSTQRSRPLTDAERHRLEAALEP